MNHDIFISYRRQGGFTTAKHLHDLLKADGYTITFDIDTLRSGDFDVELLKRIDQCQDFIIILNEGVFDRCFDTTVDPKNDWLRNELAYALKKNKNVIPVMLNGFKEFPPNLPSDIIRVERKNGPKYDLYYFDDFYRRLKEKFLHTPSPDEMGKRKENSVQMGSILRVKPDIDCRIMKFGEELCIAKAGEFTGFPLREGNYLLEFISTKNAADKFEMQYSMKNNNMEDMLVIELIPIRNERLEKEEKDKINRLQQDRIEEEIRKMKEKEEEERLVLKRKEEENLKRKEKLEKEERDRINRLQQNRIEEEIRLKKEKERLVLKKIEEEKLLKKEKTVKEKHLLPAKINEEIKKIVSVKYDEIDSFHEGLARVRLDKKYGFINEAGEEIIAPTYSKADCFSDGTAIVKLDKKWGAIDREGNIVVPFTYVNRIIAGFTLGYQQEMKRLNNKNQPNG